MKKIELPSKSKQILRDLQNHTHRLLYREEYYECIKILISNGLIEASEIKDSHHAHLKLTSKGKVYLYENPTLSNPSIWDDKKYLINTIISVIALIMSLIAIII